MEAEKKAKLIFVGILCIFALITGLKTWGIVQDEILPDLRGEASVEVVWNPYSDRWSFGAGTAFDLEIQLTDVDIILRTHDAEEVSAVFEGERRQERQSRQTALVGNEQEGSIRIYEQGHSGDLLGLGSTAAGNGEYRGLLTVFLPAQGSGFITLRTFSGDISISNTAAEMITMESTKGSLSAAEVTATGNLKLSSFDGDIILNGFSAADCTLSASAGNTSVKRGILSTLYLEQYSGKLELESVTAQGKVTISGSDSAIALRTLSAGSVYAELSAGSMTLNGIEVSGAASLKIADGEIKAEALQAQRLEMTGKNGNITGGDIAVGQTICKSEGGNISLGLMSDCHITASSKSGNIMLTLPSAMGFRLAVGTVSGQRDIGFQTVKYYLGSAADDYYECQVGSGEWTVNIETDSGDVSLQADDGNR